MADEKAFYAEKLLRARQRVEQLPESSQIKRALPDQFFDDLYKHIDEADELRYWPPFFGFLVIANEGQLTALDRDLDLVLRSVGPKNAKGLTKFLLAKTRDSRFWYGGLFDMWVRAELLRQGQDVEFDVPLPNGRDSDVRVQTSRAAIRLENTVITEDDESREVWNRFLDAKKLDPDKVLIRPGPYDPPNAKGPSPYYNTLRLYAKVYDKVANEKLDPSKSQCANDEPNVLLVSFSGHGVDPNMPGYGWALDELFNSHRVGRVVEAPHLHDISLDAWIDFRAAELRRRGQLTLQEYDERMRKYGEITAAPRHLGGVILFDGFKLAAARINYNAYDECSVTHAEMAELERQLNSPPQYAL